MRYQKSFTPLLLSSVKKGDSGVQRRRMCVLQRDARLTIVYAASLESKLVPLGQLVMRVIPYLYTQSRSLP